MASPLPIAPSLPPQASIVEAAKVMASEEVFVIDDLGKLIGVVRHLDVVRSMAEGLDPRKTPIKQIMLKPPPMVSEDATLEQVSKVLAETDVRRILVRRGKDVIGLIEIGELFGLISGAKKIEVFKALSARARLKIAELLSIRPMSVDELSEELGIRPITVRHHLNVLRRAGMIEETQSELHGKVGRPLSLFITTESVMKRRVLRFGLVL